MGEIADAMLDGTLCEGCGEYIGLDTGFPGYCSTQCAKDRGAPNAERHEPRLPKFNRYSIPSSRIQRPGDALIVAGRMPCPFCVKRVKLAGMGQHLIDLHRDKLTSEETK